jgi:hypothetical protein
MEFGTAITELETCRKLDPDALMPLIGLARCYQGIKNWKDSMKMANLAIQRCNGLDLPESDPVYKYAMEIAIYNHKRLFAP